MQPADISYHNTAIYQFRVDTTGERLYNYLFTDFSQIITHRPLLNVENRLIFIFRMVKRFSKNQNPNVKAYAKLRHLLYVL